MGLNMPVLEICNELEARLAEINKPIPDCEIPRDAADGDYFVQYEAPELIGMLILYIREKYEEEGCL